MDALADLRQEYSLDGLTEADLEAEPLDMLRRWVDEAVAAEVDEPNAMVLSTVDATGRPSSRTVLLKGLDEGLLFYTNYSSRKGEELAGQPRCALLFLWLPMQRQVRVEGVASRLTEQESFAYFTSRPRTSQLGAWSSPQSRVVDGRERLDERYAEMAARFGEGEIPLPPFWGGYRVVPDRVEFWQGRKGRMHDRLRYRHAPMTDGWVVERLAP